jgi:hypothetical protein
LRRLEERRGEERGGEERRGEERRGEEGRGEERRGEKRREESSRMWICCFRISYLKSNRKFFEVNVTISLLIHPPNKVID